MIVHIQDTDENSFVRHWSERVWDAVQLAQIGAIENELIRYAQLAWRPMSIEPPSDILVLTTCDEGVVLMMRTQLGEWRTSQGLPHRPPRAWMPCPPPHFDGRP